MLTNDDKDQFINDYAELCRTYNAYIDFVNTDYQLEVVEERYEELSDVIRNLRRNSGLEGY